MFFFTKIPTISLDQIKNFTKIIDVRTPQEFKSGNVKGSRNIPLDRLQNFKSNETVYVICQTGSRSKAAVKYLRKQGIDAINIKGGISAYRL